jgi:sirohydrochlorin cobaltochelatase
MADGRALVLFAHGARDPEWAQPFEKIAQLIRERNPGMPVVVAFLEIMQPALDAAVATLVAQGRERITLVPLFLARGGHVKDDLPQLVRAVEARYPGVQIRTTAAIGEVDSILGNIAQWAEDQFLRTDK